MKANSMNLPDAPVAEENLEPPGIDRPFSRIQSLTSIFPQICI
jgi:hypothetical protein